MKLLKVVTGLFAILINVSVQAITLKLSADIDLLVLDGHKISGSLLKGADGLELDRSEHQLLFRVEKTFNLLNHSPVTWISVPQIATFITCSQAVLIQLPPLHTLYDGKSFDKQPTFYLLDEHGNEIASKRDHLLFQDSSDLEQVMLRYNLNGKIASVPRFAQPGAHSAHVAQNASSQQTSVERMLHLWYIQADSAIRQHFVILMKALHTS